MREKPRIRSISFAILALGLCTPALADASPGVDGTRNLSMGNATRGSSAGTQAAIINPAGLMYGQQFAIEGMYQYDAQRRTHGMGVFISDSLNTPRIALSLGYVFMRGDPKLLYTDAIGDRRELGLVHYGHEVSGTLGVAAIKNWLYFGIKPKWQYSSLRYLDDEALFQEALARGLDRHVHHGPREHAGRPRARARPRSGGAPAPHRAAVADRCVPVSAGADR